MCNEINVFCIFQYGSQWKDYMEHQIYSVEKNSSVWLQHQTKLFNIENVKTVLSINQLADLHNCYEIEIMPNKFIHIHRYLK